MLVLSGQRGINQQGIHDRPNLNGLEIRTVGNLQMPFTSCNATRNATAKGSVDSSITYIFYRLR
jgi:hypothetical protein